MRFPAPLSVAEKLAAALPATVREALAHRPEMRRALAVNATLELDGWRHLAEASLSDHPLRAQLIWHPQAAGQLGEFLTPADEPATLAAALIAHPAEAATLIASWDDLDATIADYAVSCAPTDAVRWQAAMWATVPVALEVALTAVDRSDGEVAQLVDGALARRRPPEPPLLLLRLCADRPALAQQWLMSDPYLALPAAASGVIDPAVIAAELSERRDPTAVSIAALVASHPDTPPSVVAELRAGPLVGHPAPWSPHPLPKGWGRPDSQRTREQHDLVVAAVHTAPQPWGRWLAAGLDTARTHTARTPRWPLLPVSELTYSLGFRHSAIALPPPPPVDLTWRQLLSMLPLSGSSPPSPGWLKPSVPARRSGRQCCH